MRRRSSPVSRPGPARRSRRSARPSATSRTSSSRSVPGSADRVSGDGPRDVGPRRLRWLARRRRGPRSGAAALHGDGAAVGLERPDVRDQRARNARCLGGAARHDLRRGLPPEPRRVRRRGRNRVPAARRPAARGDPLLHPANPGRAARRTVLRRRSRDVRPHRPRRCRRGPEPARVRALGGVCATRDDARRRTGGHAARPARADRTDPEPGWLHRRAAVGDRGSPRCDAPPRPRPDRCDPGPCRRPRRF